MTGTDLPTLGLSAAATGNAVLVEAFGDPRVEQRPATVALSSLDVSSDSWQYASLRRWSDHRPVTSMERWLRVHFQKPYGAISGLRFWVSGLVPNTDWTINWGTTTTYVKPIDGYSAFANEPILTADPGIQNVPLNIDATGRTYAYSDWIILQAVYAGSTPGSMQSGPVNLNLAWSVA